jgi:cytoskeletal protein CcmA (bactofilin family)
MPPRPSDAARPAIERPGIERPPASHAEPPAAPRSAPRRNETEQRTLIVGREISLSGEITSCDRLVVEGSVEANLANCREIDIAESGLFKGTASIDDAEIRGRFEGTLIARQHLHIRSTGRVTATVSYAEVEIEPGGQLSGTVQVLSPGGPTSSTGTSGTGAGNIGGGNPGGSAESPRLPR